MADAPRGAQPRCRRDNGGEQFVAVQAAALREQRWALPSENVIVTGGVVHLWGVIESEEERRAIRITAEGVPGVKSVESHLEYAPIIPAL
jgi:osmotically-inducible protein OsmY